jgi:cytochrome P450
MLSLDGEQHGRHRAPFTGPFRPLAVKERFTDVAAEEANRLVDALEPAGRGELRRGFAGPMSAAIVTHALGLGRGEVDAVLAWYDAIVASVTRITAGEGPTEAGQRAFAALADRIKLVIDDRDDHDSLLASAAAESTLTHDQIVSDAAVLLFGGIETTEGMIATALLMLLEHPAQLHPVRADPALLDAAIDESLRLEPAAAVVDRYATADTQLGDARIPSGDLVRLSLAGANRDPAVFSDPDSFDLARTNRRHLAFAQGPHVCVGVHLARLEARVALSALLQRLDSLCLDPDHPAEVRGLVFRKPQRLDTVW